MNKKIVNITCYGKATTMKRKDAIELYSEGIMCSEGSERDRYINILIDLYEGKDNCSDREN